MSSVSLINGHIDRSESNSERKRLKELMIEWGVKQYIPFHTEIEMLADYLLANGVIVPPCKVGDKIYKLWYTPCHNGETHPDSWGCVGCYDKCDIKKTITKITIPNMKFIVENFMSGYNTVYFISEEEAEAALKGGVE